MESVGQRQEFVANDYTYEAERSTERLVYTEGDWECESRGNGEESEGDEDEGEEYQKEESEPNDEKENEEEEEEDEGEGRGEDDNENVNENDDEEGAENCQGSEGDQFAWCVTCMVVVGDQS